MQLSILFLVDLVIGFFLLRYLRNQDPYKPEPLYRMALFTVLGGAISIALTIGASSLLHSFGLYEDPSYLDFFAFTGPIEESSKLLAFFLLMLIFRVKIEESVDGIIYIGCVALGFSLIENFGYSSKASWLIATRSFSSTPMHIVFSSILGLAYAEFVLSRHKVTFLIRALVVASLLHGFYDSLVQSGLLRGWSILYLLLLPLFALGQRALGYTLLNSPFRKTLADVAQAPSRTEAKACLVCSSEQSHHIYTLPAQVFKECQGCQNVILSINEMPRFLNYFLPCYQSYARRIKGWNDRVSKSFVEFSDKNYDLHKRFKIQELSPVLESLSLEMRAAFEKSATFSFVFATRPLLSGPDGIIRSEAIAAIQSKQLKVFLWVMIGIFGFIAFMMATIKFVIFLSPSH